MRVRHGRRKVAYVGNAKVCRRQVLRRPNITYIGLTIRVDVRINLHRVAILLMRLSIVRRLADWLLRRRTMLRTSSAGPGLIQRTIVLLAVQILDVAVVA